MKRTQFLLANLNKVHWDRKPWEVGYRGPPSGKRKVTRKPHAIVHDSHVAIVKERLAREWEVMKMLNSPYLNKEEMKPYHEIHGTFLQEQETIKKNEAKAKMPGDPKLLLANGEARRTHANYGNLLHKDRSIEDSLCHLIRRSRWD
ncbi:unnamed protein product [Bursaphelenchus xylophilus]|uniref:(pine wood nematode) hypothetical protein n=1 Tax=Bursaphelenchus xylophilus TaxID=6326 RepID=A0A1I7RYS9_BURXY|nr:unnamed protein product [Bursaphelenchus xylophilus]CAG9092287.1 unnamed protein product [Bursaphelenchus xylophilus]